jgi:hypothetical protein
MAFLAICSRLRRQQPAAADQHRRRQAVTKTGVDDPAVTLLVDFPFADHDF